VDDRRKSKRSGACCTSAASGRAAGGSARTRGRAHGLTSIAQTLGASNYTYAEATLTQSLPDWIGAHVRALAFIDGVPAQLVPDNPRVGVDRANWYEPMVNRTYADMARHYRTAIVPARPYKPREIP
jgi:transposase